MEDTSIKDLCSRVMRRKVGSTTAISTAAKEWNFSLIGKLISPDVYETWVIIDEVNKHWKKYKNKEVKAVGRNLFLFKFDSKSDMEEVVKNSPWNFKSHHINLKKYSTAISYEDYSFDKQEWNVKFKNMLIEHQSEDIIKEACLELGTLIFTIPSNCKPKGYHMITARVEIDLNKPLLRGGYWNTASGKETWQIYYWERQPHSLCDKCFVINHDEEKCESTEDDMIIRKMCDKDYESYCKEMAKAYGADPSGTLDEVIQKIAIAKNHSFQSQANTIIPKTNKRPRENILEKTSDETRGLDKEEPNDMQMGSSSASEAMEHDLVDEEVQTGSIDAQGQPAMVLLLGQNAKV